MDFSISTTTFCIIIIVVFGIELILELDWFFTTKFNRHKRLLDFFPSLLSSLGVLGTFWGIFVGLQDFDVNNITSSIPTLLEGLKTAFVTSLLGMLLSLVSNAIINAFTDKDELENPTELDVVAAEISRSVAAMGADIKQTLNDLKDSMSEQNKNLKDALTEQKQVQSSFYASALSNLNKMDALKSSVDNVTATGNNIYIEMSSQHNAVMSILSLIDGHAQAISQLEEASSNTLGNILSFVSKLEDIRTSMTSTTSYTGEILEQVEAILPHITQTAHDTNALSGVLRQEVINIVDKMESSNNLLERKFDEFSELLKKNNTEALVLVMKAATEEFQKTMGELVNKLVQENFDQLNKSVENLNNWQQENKQMISELTARYVEMNQQFQQTSTILTAVAQYVSTLAGAESKLAKIEEQLTKVMVDDTKFTEITGKLSDAAEKTKTNIDKMHDYSENINKWVRGHQDIQDAVNALVMKLEELNKIRDYNDQFWKDTKAKLNEGVGTIQEGTKELNRQLSQLDQHFYERLSTTLANLDECIRKMIDYSRNHRI